MKKFTKTTAVALALALSLSLGAGVDADAAAKVNKVKVTADGMSGKTVTIAKGKKKQLTVKINGKAIKAKKNAKNVTFKSSNSKIVSVTKKGVISAKKTGNAKVTVTSKKNKKKKFVVKVKVVKTAVKKVTAKIDKATLNVGETAKVSYTVTKKAKFKKVSITSSDAKIASVTKKGVVTAKAAGTAKITVKALDGSNKKASVTVTVNAPTPAPGPAPAPAPTKTKYTTVKLTEGAKADVTVSFAGDKAKAVEDLEKLVKAAGIKENQTKDVVVNGKAVTVVLKNGKLWVTNDEKEKTFADFVANKTAKDEKLVITYGANSAKAVAALQLASFVAQGTYTYDVTIDGIKATSLTITKDGIKATIDNKTYDATVNAGVIEIKGDVSQDAVMKKLVEKKYADVKVIEK